MAIHGSATVLIASRVDEGVSLFVGLTWFTRSVALVQDRELSVELGSSAELFCWLTHFK
jgi:hypothetical protein